MRWQILSVDDDPDVGRQIKGLLEVKPAGAADELTIDALQDFDEAMRKLDTMLYDLVIIDVFKGKAGLEVELRPGADLLRSIKERCFVPVVFYTALPAAVNDQRSELVHVVHKTTGGLDELRKSVMNLIGTGLPLVNRALITHFFKVQAEYMWEFVQPHWANFAATPDRKSLAYLLARRLAASLSRENIHILITSLGGSAAQETEDAVHPMEYYIHPPVGEMFSTGDILVRTEGERRTYHIILTPTCDMVVSEGREVKSEYVIIAGCTPLTETTEGKEWMERGSDNAKKALVAFMKNNKQKGQPDRHYFIPGTFFLPDLFADFQLIQAVPFATLETFERVASLDSPFAECLLNRFSRYMGRVGTPDVPEADLQGVADRVRPPAPVTAGTAPA